MTERLILVRHGESYSNNQRNLRKNSNFYQKFIRAYAINPLSEETRSLAQAVLQEFPITRIQPLTESGRQQAETVGLRLRSLEQKPDIVVVSPHERTQQTLEMMKKGWPELSSVLTVVDPRIREHEWGKGRDFGTDHRLFTALNPDEIEVIQEQGLFHYRYPEGESIEDVERREREYLNDLQKDFPRKTILVISHSMAILVIRKIIEEFTPENLFKISRTTPPINTGVTIYKRVPNSSYQNQLKLWAYNLKLY